MAEFDLPCATILRPDLERTSRFEGDGNMAEEVCDHEDNDMIRILMLFCGMVQPPLKKLVTLDRYEIPKCV